MVAAFRVWPVRQVGRPRKTPEDRNRTIGLTPSQESRNWLDPQVGAGKRWSSYTHFFDWAVNFVREAQDAKREL